jgi:undecaprenyl diphosphate synthase
MSNGKEGLHVAIVMDGNGRWAEEKGLDRSTGHRVGAERAKEIITHAASTGVKVLTLWGYSTDNHKRPEHERRVLMFLFQRYIVREKDSLVRMNARVTFIGHRGGLPENLQRVMGKLETATKDNDGLHLQIALNYGGRDELFRAVNEAIAIGKQLADEKAFENFLDTGGVQDPDLIIRTSGEQRLSGFMPWQSKYSELCFVEKHWPDFTAADFDAAIADFSKRDRRYGRLSAQAV